MAAMFVSLATVGLNFGNFNLNIVNVAGVGVPYAVWTPCTQDL